MFSSVPDEQPKLTVFLFDLGFVTAVQALIPLCSIGAILSSTEKSSHILR